MTVRRQTGQVHYGAERVTPLPRSYLAGLAITIDPDSDDVDEIEVAAGCARSNDDTTNLVLSSALKKTLDNTWAAGEGGGMNDQEAQAAGWTHVFLIGHPSGSVVDVAFDTSISGANLDLDTAIQAAGITKYRRIGSVFNDATPDLVSYTQHGNLFLWADAGEYQVAPDPTNSAQNEPVASPPDVRCEVIFRATINDATAIRLLLSTLPPLGIAHCRVYRTGSLTC